MPAMSRYLSSSSFLAEDAMAIRSPASRTRRSRSGTAEKGRTSGRYSVLKRLPAPLLQFLAVVPLFVSGQEDRNELVAALADLASSLLETHIVAEAHHRFVPCECVQIDRIDERAIQIENCGFRQLKLLHGQNDQTLRTSRLKACSSPLRPWTNSNERGTTANGPRIGTASQQAAPPCSWRQ